MIVKHYMLKTRSGLHCGTGQGLSDIDLPTAKEPVSGFPLIPGSSLKGVLRDHFADNPDAALFEAAFGQAGEVPEFASALSFGDARLICLPSRSYFGVFAYVSSPYALRVLRETLQQSGQKDFPEIPVFDSQSEIYYGAVTSDSVLKLPIDREQENDRVLLEDLDLLVDTQFCESAEQWAGIISGALFQGQIDTSSDEQTMFNSRFLIVPDDVLSFLCETALPVATRIRIGENGVVEPGALWYEEYVPPESVFIGIIAAENGRGQHHRFSAPELMNLVAGHPLDFQVGGGATIGRGMVHIQFQP